MNLLIEMFPIEHVGHPSIGVEEVEGSTSYIPTPREWINKEDIPGEGDKHIIHAVGVLQIDSAMLDVVAGVDQQFSIPVELNSLRWLVHLVRPFKILGSSLSELSLGCVNNLMQVLSLSKISLLLLDHASSLLNLLLARHCRH